MLDGTSLEVAKFTMQWSRSEIVKSDADEPDEVMEDQSIYCFLLFETIRFPEEFTWVLDLEEGTATTLGFSVDVPGGRVVADLRLKENLGF